MVDRETTLEIARLLNEVVVSGARLGSEFHDDEEQLAREWYAYCDEIDFWRRASELRGPLLDALFPEDDLPDDDDAIIAHDKRVAAELRPHYWGGR